MSTPYEHVRRTRTKLRSRNQVTLPKDVCQEAGMRTGDTVQISVHRRGVKVSEGSIVLTPTCKRAPWSKAEWRQKEKEADRSIAAGKTYGPFDTADEAIAFLRKETRARRARR